MNLEVIAEDNNRCGEGPIWDASRHRLLWSQLLTNRRCLNALHELQVKQDVGIRLIRNRLQRFRQRLSRKINPNGSLSVSR